MNSMRIDCVAASGPGQARASLEAILAAFIHPALLLSLDNSGGAAFVRVLARAYAEHNERLRKFLSENYGHVLKEFAAAFAAQLPHLDKEELYWRTGHHCRRTDLRHGRLRRHQTPRGKSEKNTVSAPQSI